MPSITNNIALRRMHSARYMDTHARESVDSIDESVDLDASSGSSSALMKPFYTNDDEHDYAGSGSGKEHSGRGIGKVARPVTLRIQKREREERPGDGVARVAALTFSTLSAVYTTYLVASSNPRSLSWFAYHPPLQMASVALFTLGILTLQPTAHPKSKAAGLVRHQLCMLLAGAPLLAAGTWSIYHNKQVKAREHFTTWHGTLGIIAVGWLAVQMVVGCSSVWFGGAAFGGGMKAKAIWKYHRISGYIVYPLFVFVAHLGGAWSTYSNARASHIMRLIAYSIGPIITVIAVFSRIRPSKMKIF